MIRAGFIIATFAASLAVSPAVACSPAPMKPSTVAQHGEACEMSWQVSEYHMVGIGKASALAPGFVWQTTFEGSGCGGAISHVVQDCASGKVMILGENIVDLMDPDSGAALEAFEAGLKKLGAKEGFALDMLPGLAARHGLTKVAGATTSDRLRMSEKTVRLNCGCKTLFPEMGARG